MNDIRILVGHRRSCMLEWDAWGSYVTIQEEGSMKYHLQLPWVSIIHSMVDSSYDPQVFIRWHQKLSSFNVLWEWKASPEILPLSHWMYDCQKRDEWLQRAHGVVQHHQLSRKIRPEELQMSIFHMIVSASFKDEISDNASSTGARNHLLHNET